MRLHRIYGVCLRYLYLFRRSLDRQTDAFYWPTVDLVLWGLTSVYFSSQAPDANMAVLVVISGILLWIVVWRGQYEVTVNILEDLWNKNLVNMFASPLKLSEWVTSFVILGIAKAVISLLFAALVAYGLYHIKFFTHGFELLPFLFLLIMTGWWVGLFVGGLIMRFGSKVQQFAWSMVFLIAPFSAVYYPLSALPAWAQKVAVVVPTSYAFEGARQVIAFGSFSLEKFIWSFALNMAYLALALYFFQSSFKKILQRGLVKLF